MKQIVRKYIKWLLPVLFVGYFSCISLFEHAHIINGVIVVHSHATKSTSSGTPLHQHPDLEFQLFHFLSHFNVADGAVGLLTLSFYSPELGNLIVYPVCPDYVVSVKGKLSLRAPPLV